MRILGTMVRTTYRQFFYGMTGFRGSISERLTRLRTAIHSRDRTTRTRPIGATKSLRPIPVGPSHAQREGRRVGKDGSTERTRLRATALRIQQHVPRLPEASYHRAEVGRGMLMAVVALEQAPRVPTTEEDAGRPDAG